MDLFENGIVKIDDIKYMASDVYGFLPKYCELKQIVLDFSYSSANVFSDITQLENPIFATSVMVSKKGKGSKVYVSASADNVENEKAFEVGNGDILSCGSLWRFIQVTGDKSGGDDVQLIVTGYELGYAFTPIPIEKAYISGTSTLINSSFTFQLQLVNDSMRTYTALTDVNGDWRVDFDDKKVQSMVNAFYGNVNITSVDLSRMNFNSCVSFNQAFRGCNYLEKIYGVENLVTSSCTDIQSMFYACFSLKYDNDAPLDLSGWDTSNVTTMYYYFGAAISARTTWYNNTGKNAFYQCAAVNIPAISDGCDVTRSFVWNQGLSDVGSCGNIGKISGELSFAQANNLSLASAIVILSALQDLNGNTATLTFATSTQNLISADTTAMNLVAQAQSYGWTITGF